MVCAGWWPQNLRWRLNETWQKYAYDPGLTKPDSAVAGGKTHTVKKGQLTLEECLGRSPVMGTDQPKRKATEDIDTATRMGKRPTPSKSQAEPDSQQDSRDEAPPYYYANGGPTPAARIYRNARGVYTRPTIGYQFRELEGVTQVYYDNKCDHCFRTSQDSQEYAR